MMIRGQRHRDDDEEEEDEREEQVIGWDRNGGRQVEEDVEMGKWLERVDESIVQVARLGSPCFAFF